MIAAVMCVVFLLDLYVPLGTAVWLIYILPIALGFATTLPWVPVTVAVLSCLAMASGFFLELSNAAVAPHVAAINRTIAGIVYLVLGATGRVLIRNRTIGQMVSVLAWGVVALHITGTFDDVAGGLDRDRKSVV